MNYQKYDLQTPFLSPLQDIPEPPKRLYVRGKFPKEERPKVVAIVGSRHNTVYGEVVTQRLVKELVKRGVLIVSGLAYGIDSIAHRACLDAGGITVAVLGTSIDKIYPISHRALAHRILQEGAIISEYAPGEFVPPKSSFIIRNRIVSGLADAVVVIEAGERSGTLATASHALNQGKELFAVPGDITRPMSIGCNRLIEQGAHVYTSEEDVLNFLFPKQRTSRSKQLPLGDNPLENSIISLLAQGITDGEEIMAKTKQTVDSFNQTITILELKGVVRAQGFNQWLLLC